MKLLILTQKVDAHDDNLGFFHRWIEEFAKRCESVLVICLYEGAHHLPDNVRVLSLGKEEQTSRPERVRRLFRYVWRERDTYDAVFVHMNQIYVVLCGLLWRLWRKRVALWYAHGKVPFSLRVALLLCDEAFTSTAQSLRIESAKRRVIGHGIDTSIFERLAEGGTSSPQPLVSWGRISPSKDYMTMLRAIKRLHEQGRTIHLDIIGGIGTPDQRRYLDMLTEYVRDSGLSGVVTFVGPVPHDAIPSHITKCDIFIHTSATGSLDKAALEAMAGGLLVLTCNESVAGILPEDAREVMVFPPGDDAKLSEKIALLIDMPLEKRRVISDTLCDMVRTDHSLDALIAKICAVLCDEHETA